MIELGGEEDLFAVGEVGGVGGAVLSRAVLGGLSRRELRLTQVPEVTRQTYRLTCRQTTNQRQYLLQMYCKVSEGSNFHSRVTMLASVI